MTAQQKALVCYWLSGAGLLVALLAVRNHADIRLFVLLALAAAFVLDKTLKPPRPATVPTPLQLVQSSALWRSIFVAYALVAVILAILAVSIGDLGAWLVANRWVLVPLVLAPIAGPIVQSEIARYRACGDSGT